MSGITIALAGDTMLGRGVAAQLSRGVDPRHLFDPAIVELTRSADLFVLNLECCISERGTPWPDPDKPYFFRAPPVAVEALTHLGVTCVTLANNHALDFGADALLDTLEHLAAAGIGCVGAGRDLPAAREPTILEADGLRVGVIGVTDHPPEFEAGPNRPGVAFADLRRGVPSWLVDLIGRTKAQADVVVVTPHWGPNMTPAPVAHVRRAPPVLLDAGAALVAGHSAHLFHGVAQGVLYDMGDFIDDYAVDAGLRNDLGLLFLVEVDADGPRRVDAIPLRLEYAHTRMARGTDAEWIAARFMEGCAALGTRVERAGDRLIVRWR